MARRTTHVPTLALPFYGGLRDPNAPIHGANIAITEALESIVRFSAFPRIRVFAPADHPIPPIESWLGGIRPLVRAGAEGLSVESTASIPHRPWGHVDAWHSVTGRNTRGLHIRRVVGGRFPVTGVHHSFAGNSELHEWVLRLLLDDVRPYDSQLATSRSGQLATRRIIRQVQRSLERQLGCTLPYRGRVDLAPLGVDTEVFRPRDKLEVRRELGLPVDELLVLWVGRLSAAGKADLVPGMTVVAELMHRTPQPIRLVIAGADDEGYVATLRTHAAALGIAERVWLQVPLPPAQRHLWHAAADVFISPADSMQETFGLTCIEAMACGVPQVVADWDGYRDTVVEGVTGHLAPTTWIDADRDVGTMAAVGVWSFDHFALAQAVVVDMEVFGQQLARLLVHEDLRRRMGEASRARALERYSWPAVVARYDALWSELGTTAKAAPAPKRGNGSYIESRYVATFRGNATHMIDTSARLVLSERGQRVVAGEEGFPQYFVDHGFTLDYDLIEDALVLLSHRGKSIAQIVARVMRGRTIHHDLAVRHVVWLLKYGLARLLPDRRP